MPLISCQSEPAHDSDEQLMSRYADGCGDAFAELFARYERRAYGYFLKRTQSHERAQDLYQELFLRTHRARHRFDPSRAFATWFFQIAHRLLIDDRRMAYRSREVPIEATSFPVVRADSDERLDTREQVMDALSGLSAEEFAVVVAAKGEGVAYSELAGRLGKSVEAVRKIASRAVQRIRIANGSVGTDQARIG